MGDSLEDNYAEELVEAVGDGDASSELDVEEAVETRGTKRKLVDVDDKVQQSLMKKKKKMLQLKSKKRSAAAIDLERAGLVADLESSDLANLFWATFMASTTGKLSKLEAAAPKVERFKTANSAKEASEVVQHAWPGWKRGMSSLVARKPAQHGSPLILYVASSALRAIELSKSLFKLRFPVAKLFAKHVKLEEHMKQLKATVCVAVGTPNRLFKLAEVGSLNLELVRLLVVDMHRDDKNFSIFDIAAVRDDLMELFRRYINKRVQAGDCDICVC